MPPEENNINTQTNQNTQTVQLPSLPENWHSGLDAELQKEESLKLFKDIPSLAKSLVHAQKQFGVDKMALPTKYTTEDEWNQIYQKLGLPKELKDYNIDVPKDLGFEEDRLNEYKAAAQKAGILPKQLQQMIAWHESDTKKVLNEAETRVNQELQAAKDELKKEWGMAHDKKMAQAQQVVKMLDDPKLVKFLEETKLGNNPQMVRMFSKLGEILGEKQVKGIGDETGKFGSVKTPDVAKRERMAILGNMSHPYYDSKHPGHGLAVAEVEQLFAQEFPHVDSGAV